MASRSTAQTGHSSKATAAAPSFPWPWGGRCSTAPGGSGSRRSREVTKPILPVPQPQAGTEPFEEPRRRALPAQHDAEPSAGAGSPAPAQIHSGAKNRPPLPPRCHLRSRCRGPERAGPYIELVGDMPGCQPMRDRATATSGGTGTTPGALCSLLGSLHGVASREGGQATELPAFGHSWVAVTVLFPTEPLPLSHPFQVDTKSPQGQGSPISGTPRAFIAGLLQSDIRRSEPASRSCDKPRRVCGTRPMPPWATWATCYGEPRAVGSGAAWHGALTRWPRVAWQVTKPS